MNRQISQWRVIRRDYKSHVRNGSELLNCRRELEKSRISDGCNTRRVYMYERMKEQVEETLDKRSKNINIG